MPDLNGTDYIVRCPNDDSEDECQNNILFSSLPISKTESYCCGFFRSDIDGIFTSNVCFESGK